MKLADFRSAIASIGPGGGPCVTVSLDLSPDATGRPVAHTSFRTGLAAAATARGDFEDWAETVRQPIEGMIDGALHGGARGLFVVANPATSLRLESHLPFRNHVRLGPGPWTFELERQSFLLARPVVVVEVSRSEVTIARVAEAEVTEREVVDLDEHWTRKTHGRASAEGTGAIGTAAGGRHSRSSLDRAVEEHRAIDAREAADAIREVWTSGDLLLLSGSREPLTELAHQLSGELASALLQQHPHELPVDERSLLALVADISTAHQLGAGDALAEAILSGGGENIARGRAAVGSRLDAGRVGSLVLHEDVVAHWGTAADARRHEPGWDDAPYEEMLAKARASGAEVMFCRLPALLEQHEGVAARTRW